MKKIFILLFLFPSFLIGMEDDQQITQISPWYSAPSEIRRAIAFHMPWSDLRSFGQTNHANNAITKEIMQNLKNMVSIVEKTYDIHINRSFLIHIPDQRSFSAICYKNDDQKKSDPLIIRFNANDNQNIYIRPLCQVRKKNKHTTYWSARRNTSETQLLTIHQYKCHRNGSYPGMQRIIHIDEKQKAHYKTWPLTNAIYFIDMYENGTFGLETPEERSYFRINHAGDLEQRKYDLNPFLIDSKNYQKAMKLLPSFAQAIYSDKEPHVTEKSRNKFSHSCMVYHTAHNHDKQVGSFIIRPVTNYSLSAHSPWNKDFMETLKTCINLNPQMHNVISCSYQQLANMSALFYTGGNSDYAAAIRNTLLDHLDTFLSGKISCKKVEKEILEKRVVKIDINQNALLSSYEARLPLSKLQNAFYGIKNPDGSIYKDIPTLLKAALCKK